MGAYVNPPPNDAIGLASESAKCGWLKAHATPVEPNPTWGSNPEGTMLVCHVLNGHFSAVGIAWDRQEFDEFRADMGGRPHGWFYAPVAELLKVSNLQFYLDKHPGGRS